MASTGGASERRCDNKPAFTVVVFLSKDGYAERHASNIRQRAIFFSRISSEI
jgi:hypothetical protein